MGRIAQTKKQKVLKGTMREDMIKVPNSLQYNGIDTYPSPPSDFNLDKFATKLWMWQVKGLVDLRILHDLDLIDLAVYCTEMSQYFKMKDYIEKNGEVFETESGYPQVRPQLSIMKNAWKNAHTIALKFGFNPISRDNIKERSEGENKSALEKLME